MTVKAVFFDLDGTLFTPTRGIAASTRKALAEMRRNGILVGIATGRGPAFVLPLLENLDLDFAVTYNGQYIVTPKEVICANPLDEAVLDKIVDFALKHNREISLGMAEGVDGSSLFKFGETRLAGLLSKVLPKGTSGMTKKGMKHVVRRFLPQSNVSKLIEKPIYQVMMIAPESDTAELEREFPELAITRSNPYSVDLIPHGENKLRGIQKLGEKFDFELSDVMAFGDSDNDLIMLEGVGIGVAMGNAREKVKEKADHVTDNNSADGIAKALAYYGLAEFSPNKDFVSKDQNFNKVKAFHKLMDGKTQVMPRAFTPMEAGFRAGFKLEEIVEFLYASTEGNKEKFEPLIAQLHKDLDQSVQKIYSKDEKVEDQLTGEVDAMVDLLYFTYGSLVLAGVDPSEIFEAVHEANMGKIFPDGSPHFDPVTHKVLKPDDWEEKFAPEKKIRRELDRQIRVAKQKNK